MSCTVEARLVYMSVRDKIYFNSFAVTALMLDVAPISTSKRPSIHADTFVSGCCASYVRIRRHQSFDHLSFSGRFSGTSDTREPEEVGAFVK